MPLPEDTCLAVEFDLSAFLALSIDLPGGISLQASIEAGTLPNLAGVVQSILAPLNAALTPLMPLFRILDVVMALIDCAKAIPDALGPPPDPSKLVKCVSKLVKAASKLLALLPPLSIPIMIAGICKVIVAVLTSIIDSIEHALTVQTSFDLARDRAALLAADPELAQGAVLLAASVDCSQANLDLMMEATGASLGPVNRFLGLLNALAGLAGLPEFAVIEAGTDPAGMLDPLRGAVEAIGTVCASLPV